MFNSFEHTFRLELAKLALITAGFRLAGSETVLVIAGSPGFDGAPGKAMRTTFFILEDFLTDFANALADGVALGHIDGGEDLHF